MNKRTRIDHDGSRDVDVQSLFEDQFELVRRIARMEQVLNTVMVSAEEYAEIKAYIKHASEYRKKQDQRIAELEGERDRLRTLLTDIKAWECGREIGDTLFVLPADLRQRIQQELDNPDAN